MNNQPNKLHCNLLFPFFWLCAALSLLRPIDAQGTTYYVATTGNDSNPGTVNQPFMTFKKGISLLQPGDTLFIRAGTYTERMDFQSPVQKTGTASAWIKIAGYPGETVTFQVTDPVENSYGPIKIRGASAYFIFENMILDGVNATHGSRWMIRDGNHHFILRNLRIKNFKGSGLLIDGNDIQVINCKIHDNKPEPGVNGGYYGIYFSSGNNVLIEGNEVFDNNGGGIHAFPGPISNAVIRNNVVHHNNSFAHGSVPGITIFQDRDYKSGTALINGVAVYNNVVYANCVEKPSGMCGGIQVANEARNVKILNNTVYGNKGYGILVAAGSNGPAENTIVQNNIAFGNATEQIIDNGVDSIISNNLTVDPKFLNVDAFNFRLQAHSPAIDAGLDLDMVKVDIMNVPRPLGAYDIGAYEGSASAIKLPFPPKGLSLN